MRDGREPYIARALAYYLIRCFGPGAFDDLIRFRFPLVPSDREAVTREMEAFAKGDYALRKAGESLADDAPNSPIPRDLKARRMIRAWQGRDPDTARRISKRELGILHDWWVIGPFESRGSDPRATVFPPEREIVFVGIDHKAGLELRPWSPRFTEVATTIGHTEDVLGRLVELVEVRGDLIGEHGAREGRTIRSWESWMGPRILPVIDEAAELTASKDRDRPARLPGRPWAEHSACISSSRPSTP